MRQTLRQFSAKVQGASPALLVLGIAAETWQFFCLKCQPLKINSTGFEAVSSASVWCLPTFVFLTGRCSPVCSQPCRTCVRCHLPLLPSAPLSWLQPETAHALSDSNRKIICPEPEKHFSRGAGERWGFAGLACLYSCLALAAFKCDLPAVWLPCNRVEKAL